MKLNELIHKMEITFSAAQNCLPLNESVQVLELKTGEFVCRCKEGIHYLSDSDLVDAEITKEQSIVIPDKL